MPTRTTGIAAGAAAEAPLRGGDPRFPWSNAPPGGLHPPRSDRHVMGWVGGSHHANPGRRGRGGRAASAGRRAPTSDLRDAAAENGLAALEVLSHFRPDAIVLALRHAGTWEVTSWSRRSAATRSEGGPVVIMSEWARSIAPPAPVAAWLPKPFAPEELSALLRRLARSAAARSDSRGGSGRLTSVPHLGRPGSDSRRLTGPATHILQRLAQVVELTVEAWSFMMIRGVRGRRELERRQRIPGAWRPPCWQSAPARARLRVPGDRGTAEARASRRAAPDGPRAPLRRGRPGRTDRAPAPSSVECRPAQLHPALARPGNRCVDEPASHPLPAQQTSEMLVCSRTARPGPDFT